MASIRSTDIRAIVQYKEMNISEREIVRRIGTSKGSVGRIWKEAQVNGWTSVVLNNLTDDEIQQLFYPKAGRREAAKPMPDFQKIHTNLTKLRNRSLFHEWRNYRKEYPDGYSYGWTTVLYNRWCCVHNVKPVLLMNEPEGMCLYIDWAGRRLKFKFGESGVTEVHFFVASLGASQYPYVEATLNETQETLIRCHINAMKYYGGVPKYIIPDNMRTAVKSHENYEIELQTLYQDLEDFYGYVVLPTGKGKPTEKNDVEYGVHVSYDWILSELEEHSKEYTSMEDVQQATRKYLDEMCTLEFRKTKMNRRQWFYEVDFPELRPLPKRDFDIYAYEFTTVGPDYHVNIKGDNHKYSVPHQYIGQNVMMKYSYTKLRVFTMARELIAEWPRSHGITLNNVHTQENHRTVAHQIAAANKTLDPNWVLEKAREIGPNTEAYIKAYMNSYKHYEKAIRGCMGIITMTWSKSKDPISRQTLEAICKEGLELRVYNYGFVKNRVAEMRGQLSKYGQSAGKRNRLIENPANSRGKNSF
jgi:transposase